MAARSGGRPQRFSLRPWGLVFALGLAACGGPPTAQLNEADAALNSAALAKRCAPEEYAAAEAMQKKARELASQGKHEEAKSAALAAKKLAERAQQRAMARREECLNPKAAQTGFDPNDLVEVERDPNAHLGEHAQLRTAYFEYNSSDLPPETRQTLTGNASWIRANPGPKVVLEGHCDSRGSIEYNLALGERRALMVRNYLMQMGVDGARLQVVSYGAEQLEDYGHTEAAHARNRRVEFRTR